MAKGFDPSKLTPEEIDQVLLHVIGLPLECLQASGAVINTNYRQYELETNCRVDPPKGGKFPFKIHRPEDPRYNIHSGGRLAGDDFAQRTLARAGFSDEEIKAKITAAKEREKQKISA